MYYILHSGVREHVPVPQQILHHDPTVVPVLSRHRRAQQARQLHHQREYYRHNQQGIGLSPTKLSLVAKGKIAKKYKTRSLSYIIINLQGLSHEMDLVFVDMSGQF
jgi:hypothetical protein